jgi:hypothetical protein
MRLGYGHAVVFGAESLGIEGHHFIVPHHSAPDQFIGTVRLLAAALGYFQGQTNLFPGQLHFLAIINATKLLFVTLLFVTVRRVVTRR